MHHPKLTVLALLLAATGAQAQSSYSIPNPIIRPQTQASIPQGQADGRGARPPAAAGDDMPQAKVPPLPQPIGQAALPGQSMTGSAPSNDTVIRETLATFSVTAIVADSAVLRNHVGYQPQAQASQSQQGGGQYAPGTQPANGSQTPSQQPRQSVIRVKSGVPVFVAGISLTPTVMESRVEFRISGRPQIISTVMLESQSAHGYVPPTTQRETIDPAVAQRTTPAGGTLMSGQNGYANGGGAAPTAGAAGLAGQAVPR